MSRLCANCGSIYDWDERPKLQQMGYFNICAINWNCQACGCFNRGIVPKGPPRE